MNPVPFPATGGTISDVLVVLPDSPLIFCMDCQTNTRHTFVKVKPVGRPPEFWEHIYACNQCGCERRYGNFAYLGGKRK